MLTLVSATFIAVAFAFLLVAKGVVNQQDQAIQLTKNVQVELAQVRLALTQSMELGLPFNPLASEGINLAFQQAENTFQSLDKLVAVSFLLTKDDSLKTTVLALKQTLYSLRTNNSSTITSLDSPPTQMLTAVEFNQALSSLLSRVQAFEQALIAALSSVNRTFLYGLIFVFLLIVGVVGVLFFKMRRSGKELQDYANLLQEVNQLVRQKNALLVSENERSQNYLDVAGVFIVVLDCDGNIAMLNNKACEILGYEESDVLGQNWFELCIPNDTKTALSEMYDGIILNHQPLLEHFESEVISRSGSKHMIAWRNALLLSDEGVIEGMICSGEDVTELKRTEDQLAFMAHHDNLTGLPNRSLLTARLQHALEIARRQPTLIAVCFFDIDNFKNINDSYGHDVGDELLITVSKRVSDIVRRQDTLARLGGDEFVLVLEDIRDKTEVAVIIEKIITAFGQPMDIQSQTLSVTTSIGISLYPQDGLDVNALIKYADTAMYQAKGNGKNAYAFYAEHMTEELMQRVYIQKDLKTAILNQQFEVFYQPQINLQTNQTIGLEALVRWNHPEKGVVMPNEFIQFAEESNSIKEIGYQVLRRACLDIKELHDEQLFDGYVAVNVSAVQLRDRDFIPSLLDLIEETQIKPEWLELELTESVVMNETKEGVSMLNSLSQIGVKIAIDDFGTGYSSLSYLSELPFDKLKIDMSFIRNILSDEKARTVAQTIIQLSNNMNMTTLAEGIEYSEQMDYLKKNHCQQGQGYLISKPKPIRKLKRWLKKSRLKAA
ncbi:MAG: EAL domain-containing protein [Thiotrichales bacterium]|nr:EAL domain-containing protein [Thiotrichales bacterium]